MAVPDECRGDACADDLLRVRVVRDDLAVAWERRHIEVGRGKAHRTREAYRAVLVGVLQPNVDDDRRRGRVPFEMRVQRFLRDARNRHGRIVEGGDEACQDTAVTERLDRVS